MCWAPSCVLVVVEKMVMRLGDRGRTGSGARGGGESPRTHPFNRPTDRSNTDQNGTDLIVLAEEELPTAGVHDVLLLRLLRGPRPLPGALALLPVGRRLGRVVRVPSPRRAGTVPHDQGHVLRCSRRLLLVVGRAAGRRRLRAAAGAAAASCGRQGCRWCRGRREGSSRRPLFFLFFFVARSG